MLSNWTQIWGNDVPGLDGLNPVEGIETLIKQNIAFTGKMIDSFKQCMDINIWQDASENMTQSWQSAVETWSALYTVSLADVSSPEKNKEEIASLRAQNDAFSMQIDTYKKEIATLKRSVTIHKKNIEKQNVREADQKKAVATKNKEIAALKKELNKTPPVAKNKTPTLKKQSAK